jgi:hypothetical protein
VRFTGHESGVVVLGIVAGCSQSVNFGGFDLNLYSWSSSFNDAARYAQQRPRHCPPDG